MSQEFQSIGKASPELDAVAAEHQGWQQDTPQSEIVELTDGSDYSFWDKRANSQVLGRSLSNMAGHTETPAAAQPVTPFDSRPHGGIA